MALELIDRKTGAIIPQPMTTVFYVVKRAERDLHPHSCVAGPFEYVDDARITLVDRAPDLASLDVAHVSVPVASRHTKLAQVSDSVLLDSKLIAWGQLPSPETCVGCYIGEPDTNCATHSCTRDR